MEFLREIFGENESLTFEQFSTAIKNKGFKLADLSKGNYVSAQKYNDDLSAKDAIITTLNTTIDSRDQDLRDLQDKLSKADEDANAQQELKDLQDKYSNDKKDWENQLNQQKTNFAIRELANTINFSSNAAKRDFITYLSAQSPKLDDKGNIIGATDYQNQYQAENQDAFRVENSEGADEGNKKPLPTFGGSTGNSGNPKPEDNPSELFGFHFRKV